LRGNDQVPDELVRWDPDACHSSAISCLRGFSPHPVLADLVVDIWDWDVPDAAVATKLAFRCLPSAHPLIAFQYRVPLTCDRSFGSLNFPHPAWRHMAVKMQTGIITVRPVGPIGTLIIRLRPEAAERIITGPMRDFVDNKVRLEDLFGASEISRVEAALNEADDSAARIRVVQDFLFRHAQPPRPNPMLREAATRLQSNPSLQIARLASHLDVSERHLSRSFNSAFGTGPKQFARLVCGSRRPSKRAGPEPAGPISHMISVSPIRRI
jgi:AraC-like DNA-binding protein